MGSWDKTRPPTYIPESQRDLIQYDGAGFLLVDESTDTNGNPRVRKELLVTISNASPDGIPKRTSEKLPDLPEGYAFLVNENGVPFRDENTDTYVITEI